MSQLKIKIEKLNYNYGAKLGYLQAKNRLEEAVEDFKEDGIEEKDIETNQEAAPVIQEIVDELENGGLRLSVESQNELMQAMINALLGLLHYKYMHKGQSDP